MRLPLFPIALFRFFLPIPAAVGGKKFVETIAAKGGEATWVKAQKIWQEIQKKYSKDQKLQGTIELLKTDPDDIDSQKILFKVLLQKLDKDPDFLKELSFALGDEKLIQKVIAEGDGIIRRIEQLGDGDNIEQIVKATGKGHIEDVRQNAGKSSRK